MAMTIGLMNLQFAVNAATFHRQQTLAKKPMARPKVADDVRLLFKSPAQYILLEDWVKSFRDLKRRDWVNIKAAIAGLSNEDLAEAYAFIIRNELCRQER